MELDTSIVCGDFFDVARTLANSSVNLIVSDWPYYKVKALAWDHQWKTAEEYLDWVGLVCEQYRRILAPNGSLYVFASPKMAARVEIKVSTYFNVLNHIMWLKNDNGARRHCAQLIEKGLARSFYPDNERIIFAEHYGADNAAKGESGYGAKCDELRGFVFEPLRAYLDGERKRAGIDKIACNVACGFSPTPGGMASRHYFSVSQWQLPTAKHYQAMQDLFNRQDCQPVPPYEDYHNAPRSRFERDHSDGEYLRAEYENLRAEYENLRVEYEDLRVEYEDLRRPFSVTAQDQYTDVWEFPTVKAYPGKHPCEKPVAMIEHIIKTSSRPGDLVADFFCGSGVTAEAAQKLDRHYFCCDKEEKWVDFAVERVRPKEKQLSLLEGRNT